MIIFASEQIAASMKKRWIVFTVLLIVALTAFLYIRFFFVFGEGVKSGELNYVVYKGLVFKTYEGKLIQSGIRSKTAGTIQSYEFEFSVENEALARKLMLLGGKTSNSTTRSISERFPGGDSRNSWSIASSQNRSTPCRSALKRNDNKLLRSLGNRLRPFFPKYYFGPTTRIRRQSPCCIVSDTPSLRSRFRRGSTTHSTTLRIRCAN